MAAEQGTELLQEAELQLALCQRRYAYSSRQC